MAKLTTKKRKALKKGSFAEPGKRKYPIPDKSHARNALSRVSGNGTPTEKAEVRAAVHKKFPGIGEANKAKRKKKKTRNATPARSFGGRSWDHYGK